MDIGNSFDITVSETLIERLKKTKSTAIQSLNNFTDKADKLKTDWQQTANQSTENTINKVNQTLEQARDSLEQNLPQVSVKDVINSSLADWLETHPAFLRVINLLNWAASHPIVSLIIIIFSLAILWNLVKLIGRLIEKASLSILQVPLKLFQLLIKYAWSSLIKFTNFVKNQYKSTNHINKSSKLQLYNNTAYQLIPYNEQQRLKDISARLEAIQIEQQELLKEAANILDNKGQRSKVEGKR